MNKNFKILTEKLTTVIFCKRGYQVQQIDLTESSNYFPNVRFDQMFDSISNREAYINNETVVDV